VPIQKVGWMKGYTGNFPTSDGQEVILICILITPTVHQWFEFYALPARRK